MSRGLRRGCGQGLITGRGQGLVTPAFAGRRVAGTDVTGVSPT